MVPEKQIYIQFGLSVNTEQALSVHSSEHVCMCILGQVSLIHVKLGGGGGGG